MSEQGLPPEDRVSDEAFYRESVETLVDHRFPVLSPEDRETKISEILGSAIKVDEAFDAFIRAEIQKPARFIEGGGKE